MRTLQQADEAGAFVGFAEEDFAVFETPDFGGRMTALRERLKPKLTLIGLALPERLTEALGEPVYPHVAQHLRRSVNPPVATWVAFARSARAYKPFVHLRVSTSSDGIRVLAFVEDYAEDKCRFADHLEANAEELARYFAHHAPIQALTIANADGQPKSGHQLDGDTLRTFADRMRRVKNQHAIFGIHYDRSHPVLANGPEFLDAIVDDAHKLRPLYDCGRTEFTYTYTPEPIVGV